MKKLLRSFVAQFLQKPAFIFQVVAILLFAALLPSCTSKKLSVVPGAAAAYDSLKYATFILDTTGIRNHPELLNRDDSSEEDKSKLLILKLQFNQQRSDTFDIDLRGYSAKNHKLHHGQFRPPITDFKKQDTGLIKLKQPLILGNIYIDWKEIIKEIYNKNTDKWKNDFLYLKFVPIDRTPGISQWNGHLRYRLSAHDKNGTKIWPAGGGGADDSKPSPPAPPYN